MIYILAALGLLIVAVPMMRVRIRLEQSARGRTLFVGLGRSGALYDFRVRRLSLRLFGVGLKSFRLQPRTPDRSSRPAHVSPPAAPPSERPRRGATEKKRRRLAPGDLWRLVSGSAGAFADFSLGLLADAIVEQADGRVALGFASPHVTGQLFGCYQAALAVAPAVFRRIEFVPVWTGAAFEGSFRLAVAWPVHRLVWRMVKLIVRLPIRKIAGMAISSREGRR